MVFYTSAEEEARAVQRAAARAGCTVRELAIRQTSAGRRAVGNVVCPDGWAAARMLLAEAIEYSTTAGARDLALALRSGAIDDESFARALHAFVKGNVRFVRESGEVFQGPAYTLSTGAGDCDDQALLLLTLAMAGGLPAFAAFLHRGTKNAPAPEGPTHAAVMLCPDGRCSWAETTVDADYGEDPLAAARRVGVLRDRGDLSQGVVTMSEKDLAPLPPDFVDKNPPEQVEIDSQTLAGLGYLDAPEETCDPTATSFRRAVAAFQAEHPPLVVDGLIGPATRAAMGETTATSLTAHLSDQFFADVAQMARDFQAKGAKVNGADFLAVWLNESGVRADIANSLGYAGLNQMGDQERKATGFTGTVADYIKLSPDDQLPYVRRHYEQDVASFANGDYSELSDAGALYLLNFLPARMAHAKDPSFVLARRAADDDGSAAYMKAHPADWYANNRGLDIGRKGWIEVGDMAKVVRLVTSRNAAYWGELTSRMAAAGDPPSGSGGIGVAGAVALVLGAGALSALFSRFVVHA